MALLLLGCAAPSRDSARDEPGRATIPGAVPAAPGDVRTRGVVMIRDDDEPQVCLGPVAESWPPQCSGPPLVGWDWRAQRLVLGQPGEPGQAGAPAYQQAGRVRFGYYALVGQWDGTALTVATSVAEGRYDAPPEQPDPRPTPEQELPEAELERIADHLGRDLPGALTAYVEGGQVVVDVVYDDGSLQAWADATYGASTVVLVPGLLDV